MVIRLSILRRHPGVFVLTRGLARNAVANLNISFIDEIWGASHGTEADCVRSSSIIRHRTCAIHSRCLIEEGSYSTMT